MSPLSQRPVLSIRAGATSSPRRGPSGEGPRKAQRDGRRPMLPGASAHSRGTSSFHRAACVSLDVVWVDKQRKSHARVDKDALAGPTCQACKAPASSVAAAATARLPPRGGACIQGTSLASATMPPGRSVTRGEQEAAQHPGTAGHPGPASPRHLWPPPPAAPVARSCLHSIGPPVTLPGSENTGPRDTDRGDAGPHAAFCPRVSRDASAHKSEFRPRARHGSLRGPAPCPPCHARGCPAV